MKVCIYKQKLQISNSVSSPKFLNYDSFTFKDTLTKSKAFFKNLKKSNQNIQTSNNLSNSINISKYSSEAQYLQGCFNILMSTKSFQKQALKKKIFTKENYNNSDQIILCEQTVKQKKQLRKFVEKQINAINRRQFRRYAQDENCKPKIQIINLSKRIPVNITQQKIKQIIKLGEGLISQEQQTYKQRGNIYTKPHQLTQSSNFEGQSLFRDKLVNHLKATIQQNGQFLITPSKYFTIRKTHNITSNNSINKHQQSNVLDTPDKTNHLCKTISKLQFKYSKYNQKVDAVKQAINKHSMLHKNQPIKAFEYAKNGNLFDLMLQLRNNENLINERDDKLNNLLHTVVKNNQISIFQILMKQPKWIPLLFQKNQSKRTPLDSINILNFKEIKYLANQALKIYSIK